jgi:hypothetical protein
MIMKQFFVFFMMALWSCAVTQETVQDNSILPEQGNQLSGDTNYSVSHDSDPEACNDAFISKEVTIMGKKTIIQIPILCESQGIDKGDPQPDVDNMNDEEIHTTVNEIQSQNFNVK